MAFRKWRKKKIWVWRAINGVSRRPLGWELGTRSDSCCKRLIDRVNDGECVFATDDWAGFCRLLPEERHFPGKDLTFPIEASNSDIRHRLARCARKSKVSSRSLHMVLSSLKLTHYLQDDSVLQPYLDPLLPIFIVFL